MPKYFIGPMSLNIVLAIIDFCEQRHESIGLIPSRRQVDFNGGYVNNWNTRRFSTFVKSRSQSVVLERDHGGPSQGQIRDDGTVSFSVDSLCLDLIHIDPWKQYSDYEEGLNKTLEFMNHIYSINKNVKFEIGTEEAIRRFEVSEFHQLLKDLKEKTPKDIFNNIDYAVVQSGVGLDLGSMNNTGDFNADRLLNMVSVCKEFGILSKEHNGDYLTNKEISKRFDLGLSAINIAPEFGQIETLCYLDVIKNDKTLSELFEICLLSKKWQKWVPSTFNPNDNKDKLIKICCHYVFSNEKFLKIKPDIDHRIRKTITKKLEELYEI